MKKRNNVLMLTPLLDLLFIIIFAQLLQASTAVEEQTELRLEAQQEQSLSDAAREESKLERERLDSIIIQQEKIIANLEKAKAELESEVEAQETSIKQMDVVMENLGELFKKQFNVPEEHLQDLIAGADERDAEKIREFLEEMNNSSPAEAIKTAKKLDEMLRRSEFWYIYIDENNQIMFSTSTETIFENFRPTSSEQTRRQFHDEMSKLPDPARMVFIIISYHSKSSISLESWVTESLTGLAPILSVNFNGTAFIVSNWGLEDTRPLKE